MDEQKKQELAEFDDRWNFEKQVKLPEGFNTDWEKVRENYNQLISEDDENDMDLFLKVSDLPEPQPGILGKIIDFVTPTETLEGGTFTFHHEGIYRFYKKLAAELEVPIGEAVRRVQNQREELRLYFDLGSKSNYDVNKVEEMDTSESTFIEDDELEELLEMEQ